MNLSIVLLESYIYIYIYIYMLVHFTNIVYLETSYMLHSASLDIAEGFLDNIFVLLVKVKTATLTCLML